MKKIRSNSGVVRRKTKILARLIVLIICLCIAAVLGFLVYTVLLKSGQNDKPGAQSLAVSWNNSEYQTVYDQSAVLLEDYSFNSTALFYHGISAFYLAAAQTDTALAQSYIDEAIHNLRIALQFAHSKTKPQISYMLGKAYFQKNVFSSYHYFSDTAVKYLEKAVDLGYESSDIPEYLGLSYADLGMTQKSIDSFTNALLVRESDILLLAIAQQYLAVNNKETAKQYLYKAAKDSKNDILILKSKSLLAQLYFDEGKYDDALSEYTAILEKDPEYADAYYGLGLLYEQQGDTAKARAEWRKVLKIQVNHQGAINKLGL